MISLSKTCFICLFFIGSLAEGDPTPGGRLLGLEKSGKDEERDRRNLQYGLPAWFALEDSEDYERYLKMANLNKPSAAAMEGDFEDFEDLNLALQRMSQMRWPGMEASEDPMRWPGMDPMHMPEMSRKMLENPMEMPEMSMWPMPDMHLGADRGSTHEMMEVDPYARFAAMMSGLPMDSPLGATVDSTASDGLDDEDLMENSLGTNFLGLLNNNLAMEFGAPLGNDNWAMESGAPMFDGMGWQGKRRSLRIHPSLRSPFPYPTDSWSENAELQRERMARFCRNNPSHGRCALFNFQYAHLQRGRMERFCRQNPSNPRCARFMRTRP